MISRRTLVLLCLAAALAVAAPPALAQYMFLDTNGDGFRTTADRLSSIGLPTTVDVWVITDHNRDGSPATCNVDAAAPLGLSSYAFNLQTVNGLASYGGFTTHVGNIAFGELNPGGGLYENGYGMVQTLPPGKYRLATLTVTVTYGAPTLTIVDRISGSSDFTNFGTGAGGCVGNDLDNTYKLAGPAGGSDWFDVDGLESPQLVPVVLAPIGNKTVSEGSCLTFTATSTLANGGTMVFTLDPGAPAGASITPGGQFTWCPTEAQGPGVYPITVRVAESDFPPNQDSETIQVTVNEVNVAPVLAAIGNKTVMAGNLLSFTATAIDGDLPANTLTFSLDPGAPAGAAITPGGNFTWTPASSQAPGNYQVTVRVTDNGTPALSDAKSFAVAVPDREFGPPVVTNPGNKTVNEGSCLDFAVTATSAGGGPLTFTLGAGAPAGASITFGGQFHWCPTEAQGPGVYTVIVNCSDGVNVGSTAFSVTVLEVNLAPVLAPIGNRTANFGVPVTFTATATDPDLPTNALAFSLDPGAPAGASINATTGAFSFVPNASLNFPVTVRVTDNGSPPLSDFESILIEVQSDETVPVVQNPGNMTVQAGATLDRTVTATDPNGLPLTFSKTQDGPAFMTVTTTSATTANIHLAPGPGDLGTYVAIVNASNGTTTGSTSFSILVEPAAVVLTPIGDKTVNEATCLVFTTTAAAPGGHSVSFFLGAGTPPGASITAGGEFSWCPTEAQGPGMYAVTICARDNVTQETDCETIQVTVLEVNTAPVLAPIGNKTGTLDVPLTFTATATDTDLPANSLTFSLGSGAPAGATIDPTTGVFQYTPSSCATLSVPILVTDNGSPPLSDAETILIVQGCTTFPVLNPIGDKTANEQILLTFTATAVTSDGSLAVFSLSGTIPPGASITTGGTFRWTPAESQGGRVWPVTVCASSGGRTDCETFNITVIEDNLAPFLAPIGVKATCPGRTLTFTVSATDADIPAQTLTFSMDPGAPQGATFDPATRTFSWTPSVAGTFVATIRVTDNGIPPLSDFEDVTITVGGSPGSCGPVLQPIANMTLDEGATATQIISGSDADGDPLTFSKVSGPFWLVVTTTSPTTGLITLTPDEAAGGDYVATVRASDGTAFDEKSFSIHVTAICHPPAADAGGPYSGTVGVPIQFNGGGSSSPDGDALTYMWSFGDGVTGTGATPAHAYSALGTYTVTLQVVDGCSLTDTDTTTATISSCLAAFFYATGNKFAMFNLGSGKPTECIQVEPVLGAFEVEDVDLASIVLRSPNSGSIDEIHAIATKNAVDGDRNGNGNEEITVCFAKEDLRLLFSEVTATSAVDVTLEGQLLSGGRFCSSQTITVKPAHGGGNLAASISPNPLNPSAVLTFHTGARGPLLVQLFDVRGRLLRTLREEQDAGPGYHDVRIDGTSSDGTRLASGVYYVRIRAGAEEERKAITILK